MSTNITGAISHEECPTEELLNPFVHTLELKTTYEKIKTAVLTVILLPIRVSIICFFVMVGWIFAYIGLWGLAEEELRQKPLDGWRKKLKHYTCIIGKNCLMAGGMNITIKGRQATKSEAPILVCAPHSTFLDGGIIYLVGFPSTICRRESGANNHIGKLINFTQPVYVWRDDPNSRHNSIKEIINRATSDLDWPQILIFPEGTCTNRSCLITFKPGAFYPGVPIQPVCIRYPNKLDTVTWTWEGPSAWKLLWLTLTQPYSNCEIEFLPVYTPSEEEKRDPKLFAKNVRAVMAKALGIPVIDYSYDDCIMMTKAKQMHLPYAPSLVEVNQLRHRLGLEDTKNEENLINSNSICKDCSKINYTDFVKLLNIPSNSPAAQQLFRIYDKKNSGVIDFREYLLGVLGIVKDKKALDVLHIACKIYDKSGHGRLTCEDFCKAACQTIALSKDYAMEVFEQVDRNQLGYITYESFISYAQKKAEFANFFSLSSEEKKKQRNGEICPNYNNKKAD
ncbi:lysophosphatidylcholine acyltransferase isoform X1 [Diabrotica virgifera virgifera]|uniref:Lysophosphatidylcholine acyltransferase isoform X1 n=1 Tax=Diabrotica virgifera virgifera TaxID=50390 RepID=A0A6P7G216_DIAVI|nr:lysophosphatidylcholine acyltransferase isoform X1 [Diabrotica virgifera virgifera]